jgi:cell division protein FtsQ
MRADFVVSEVEPLMFNKTTSPAKVTPRASRSPSYGATAAASNTPLHSQRLVVLGATFVAMLLAAGLVWLLLSKMPTIASAWPIEKVVFVSANKTPLSEIDDESLKRVASALQTRQASMLQLDLTNLKTSVKQMEWVRDANVRRQFPSTIVVSIEEHKPAAVWRDVNEGSTAASNEETASAAQSALVNSYGEVFRAVISDERKWQLPQISGPQGASLDVLEKFAALVAPLKAINRTPTQLVLTPRRAWQLTLDNGSVLQLGRSETDARLERFIKTYPQVAALQVANSGVDLRYQSGFAIRNMGNAGNADSAAKNKTGVRR